LPKSDAVASIDDIFDSGARWNLINLAERTAHIELKPRLVSSDLRVKLQAAVHGIGIALLPEQVISAPPKERLVERVPPEWSGAKNIPHFVYPTPRGMLPSVRSLIDYLLIHFQLGSGSAAFRAQHKTRSGGRTLQQSPYIEVVLLTEAASLGTSVVVHYSSGDATAMEFVPINRALTLTTPWGRSTLLHQRGRALADFL
jgi:LysR substrate binding domain